MGKRLSRAALIEEIQVERNLLDELLTSLSPKEKVRRDVTKAKWSVKDILGHLVGWQQLNLGWLETARRGECPVLPAEGFKWSDVRALNESIYRSHRNRSLAAVEQDYASHHAMMLDLIDSLTDDELVSVEAFPWAGKKWAMSDYIRANTASHYRWASKHIRKWKRTVLKG